MIITCKRFEFTPLSTIGELTTPEHTFFTLEDTDRGLRQDIPIEGIKAIKVYGKTAIPYGKYEIGISYSNHFKKRLPILFNVPGFEGIRIHSGNFPTQTEGCLLLGLTNPTNPDTIYNSRAAMVIFMEWLWFTMEDEKVFIEIVKG